MVQCQCLTKQNTQCKNSAKTGDLYCWRHSKCTKAISSQNKQQKPRTPKKVNPFLGLSKYKLNEELSEAVERGEIEKVKQLLKAGANVHASDDWALEVAAMKGYLEIVKELFKWGEDVYEDNNKELNHALSKASVGGHLKVVKFLLSVGADPNYVYVDLEDIKNVEIIKELEKAIKPGDK